jgi:hypothetical protein
VAVIVIGRYPLTSGDNSAPELIVNPSYGNTDLVIAHLLSQHASAHTKRRKAPMMRVARTFVIGLTYLSAMGATLAVATPTQLVSEYVGDTPWGGARPAALSSGNGRYVLFENDSLNVMTNVVDMNVATDTFLFDRVNNVATLISRSASDPNRTADRRSVPINITPDGEWVLIASEAGNLVPSQTATGPFGDPHIFLHQRTTGMTSLVSRVAGSAATSGNGRALDAVMTANAEWILFSSLASNLVPGQIDTNNEADVFLFHRISGAVTLVSRSLGGATTTANGSSRATAVSNDGEWVLFSSRATDLTPSVDSNNAEDVFLFRRSTNSLTQLSLSAASSTTSANSGSIATAMSPNGDWILFESTATNVIAGQVATAPFVTSNAFIVQRSTGSVTLASRAAASAAATANSSSKPIAISDDGEWVLYSSLGTNLVSGVTDGNTSEDVFLFRRSTGMVTLVSSEAGAAMVAANGRSIPRTLSPDGDWVLFASNGTNLVSDQIDGNNADDVFLYQRSTGLTRLASRAHTSPTTTSNGRSIATSLSADGSLVLFGSFGSNLAPNVTDISQWLDAFAFDRTSAEVTLVAPAATRTSTLPGTSGGASISGDGKWVAFQTTANEVLPGLSDTGSLDDVFLRNRKTGAISLVSRSAVNPGQTANGRSFPSAMTPDGEWLLVRSGATDLVAGQVDQNNAEDLFLHQRSTGAITLVSRSVGSETATANAASAPNAISDSGEWVVFSSRATNLVNGFSTNGSNPQLYLWQRSTGQTLPITRSATVPGAAGNGGSGPARISADGEWVTFLSTSTDLVPGVSDSNDREDVFVYQRSTATTTLLSRSHGDPFAAADGGAGNPFISATGEWIAFESASTNLVSGLIDNNQSLDVFLCHRATGAVQLVSRSAVAADQTSNRSSLIRAINADGTRVLFESFATDLIADQIEGNNWDDVFIYTRGSGEVQLVSRSVVAANTTGNRESKAAGFSADGKWVLFLSRAGDLVSSMTDANGQDWDVFLYLSSTGAIRLLSRAAASETRTGNFGSSPLRISRDGQWVLFESRASDLLDGISDQNQQWDVFLTPAGAVFEDGFEDRQGNR